MSGVFGASSEKSSGRKDKVLSRSWRPRFVAS